jgi:hypothetical protein
MSERSKSLKSRDPETFARLQAEARAPYRGLRRFIYFAFGGSGAIGAFVFLTQALAGREIETALPNLALQVGLVALMVWLFRIDREKNRKP